MPGGLQCVGFGHVAADVDGDVVVAYAGGGLNVNDRLGFSWIRECDFTAFQMVLGPIEGNLATFVGAYPADGDRMVGGAADAKVGASGEFRDRGLHLQFGGGHDMNVKPKATFQGIGSGDRDRALASFQIGAKVESRRYS